MAPKAAKAPASLLDALARAGLSGRGFRAALEKCNASAVRAILTSKSGASLASKTFEDGKWPLTVAIDLLGQDDMKPEAVVDVVSALLEGRACPNQALPPLNESPLQLALRMDSTPTSTALPAESSSRHLACVHVALRLLESRADPNHLDDMGEGPLAEAAIAGNVDAVKVLLAHGASLEQRNLDGKCPLELDIPSSVRALFEKGVGTQEDAAAADAEALANDQGLLATDFFDMGSEHFMAQRYTEARACYSKALVREPGSALFAESKVAACMVLGDFHQGFVDSSSAARGDVENGFVHEQCARCLLMLNRLQEACDFCNERLQHITKEDVEKPDPQWSTFCRIAERTQQHADAMAQINMFLNGQSKTQGRSAGATCYNLLKEMLEALGSQAERKSPWARHLRLTKVRVVLLPLAEQSRQKEQKRSMLAWEACEEALALAEDHPRDPDVLYWLACSLLSMSRRHEACEGLRAAISANNGRHAVSEHLLSNCILAENHQEAGRAASERQEYDAALEHFDSAINAYFAGDVQCLDRGFLVSLLCDRSAAWQKHAAPTATNSALDDVTRALDLKPKHAQALFQRAQLYMDLQRYKSAQDDFEKVATLEPGLPGLREARGRAEVWAKKPPKQNYYAVLGVGFDASEDCIKKAYKAAALRWHPDKNPGDEEAQKNFVIVQEAFEVLSDPRQKFEYDGFERAPLTHATFFGANFGAVGHLNSAHFGGVQFGSSQQSSQGAKKPVKELAAGKTLDFKGWSFNGAKSCHTHTLHSTFTPPARNGRNLEG